MVAADIDVETRGFVIQKRLDNAILPCLGITRNNVWVENFLT
jgi:hypothetical protein